MQKRGVLPDGDPWYGLLPRTKEVLMHLAVRGGP